jgi:threonine synthase
VADPHTAVGLEVARRWWESDGERGPILVLATAHPAKFPDVLSRALGSVAKEPDRLRANRLSATRVEEIAADGDALKRALLEAFH